MFFNMTKVALGVLVLLFTLSCAKEKEQTRDAIEVDFKSGTGCLSDFGADLVRYVKAELSVREVEELWDCTAAAVRAYHRLTVGEGGNGEVYAPSAIRDFLQKYFIKSTPLTDPLLSSLMELKRVVLSGRTDALTRYEIERLLNFITLIKSVSVQLHPHLRTLFTDHAASDGELHRAVDELTHALGRLGSWLDANRQPYTYEHLSALFQELRKLGQGRDDLFNTVEKVIAILPTAKGILIHGSQNGIDGQEWSRLMRVLGRGFHFYNNVRRAVQRDLNAGLSRQALPDGIDQLRLILSDAVRIRPKGQIDGGEWMLLFQELERSGLLPADLKAQPMGEMWNWILHRLLGAKSSTGTLTSLEVKNLKRPIELWRDLLENVGDTVRPGKSDRGRFAAVLAAADPQQWDAKGRLEVVMSGPSAWTAESRKRMAWPHVILTWVKEAYVGQSPDQINEEQLNLAVAEILPRLQAFGWLKSTKLTIGSRLMREANLFTLSGNGTTQLEIHEAVRYLAFVASAYRSADLWLEKADQACGNRKADCVRRLVHQPKTDILNPLPRLKALVHSRDPAFFDRYMKHAEETVLGKTQKGEFGTGDLLQVWMLFQYVETFLRRFDLDRNETIELPESLQAFEIYGATLGRLLPGGQMPPDEVLAFFTFMMNYGDTPFGMFGGQVLFNHWRWHRDQWVFSADRAVLMAILNQLSKL